VSELEDRLERARESVKEAHNRLYDLGAEERKEYKVGLTRLERAIAYATVVLEATQPDMLVAGTAQAVINAADQITNNPSAALQGADAYADGLITAVAPIPLARDRDVEQQVREAAATFQRSAGQRLGALKDEINQVQEELETLKQGVADTSGTVSTEISGQVTAFEAKLTELEQTIATQRQALDDQMTRQSSAFSETQEERATEFQEGMEAFRSELARSQKRAQEDVDKRVAEIRRMEEESRQLVGAIGVAGTADRYTQEAKEQRRVANVFRALAIIVALGAVTMAIIASVHKDQTTQALSAKLAVSAIFGGLSAYLARQSGRHRRREEHAQSLQLELAAFGPFIEPLIPEQREEERVIMARKTFGKTTKAEASEEEPGPAPLSFLMQRRQKKLEAGIEEDEE